MEWIPAHIEFTKNAFDEELGIWVRMAGPVGGRSAAGEPQPALFLDRDGVIVEEIGYLHHVDNLVLLPGADEIIALANKRGVPVVEVTNQAGIARGYFGWKEFLEIEEALAKQLAQAGAGIDAALACPYHPEGLPPWAHPAHPCRKPRPGMLLAAARLLNLDLKRSWIVGDKVSDLLAGYNAGLRGALHVLTGHGREHRQAVVAQIPPGFELRLGSSIRDAAPLIELLAQPCRPVQ